MKEIDKPIIVLLIEDNPGDVRLIREMLLETEGAPFQLEHADRLMTRLKRLSEEDIDVVMLDIGLPDSHGLDTFDSVHDQAPEVPVIVLTGFDDMAAANRAIREGAQDHLIKGQVDGALLVRSLHYAIERKKAQAHITHLNSVLRAIRDVNQLIVVEKDRERLIRKVCDILIGTRGYEAVLFGLMRDADNFAAVVGSGFGDAIPGFCERVMAGDHPPCIRTVLAHAGRCGVVAGKSGACGDCFFRSECADKNVLLIRSEHDGRLFGLFAVSLAHDLASDDDEKELLKEVASDIALALHRIESAELHRASEDALRQSEENYRTIFDAANDAIVVHDIETGDIIDANKKWYETHGYTLEEARRFHLADLCVGKPSPYAQEDAMQWFRKASEEGPQLFEWLSKDVSGRLFWTEVNLKRVAINGKDRLLAVIRDITERKAAEVELEEHRKRLKELVEARTIELTRANAALQESEERFRTLTESISDWIWEVDENATYTYASPRLKDLLGYESEEVIGKTPFDLMHPEDAKHVATDFGAIAETQRPFSGLENVNVHKDGRVVVIETSGVPILDAGGNFRGYRGIDRDITERKRAEEALVVLKEQYRMLVEQAGQMMYAYDIQTGQITWSGDVRIITGCTPDEFQKVDISGWERLIHPDDRKAALALLEEATEKCSSYQVEYRFRHKDGAYHYVEDNGIFLAGESGNAIRMLGTMKDIAERKDAEVMLEQALSDLKRSNTDLEQFAYIVSHDLQEPLRMVSSYMELLRRRYEGKLDHDADDFIGFAVDGASRMQTLIRDLLIYSRVGTRGKSLTPTDCEYIFPQVLADLKLAIEDSGAVVTCNALPTLNADASQLIRLFQNLIGNAIKFRGDNPVHIHVAAEQKGSEWLFSVADNGIGIPPEYFDRIFVVFERLHARDEYSGTGIGLAVCKKIVERHGGRMWVKSEIGQGSTFYFTIPTKATGEQL
ncbi:MAG: PAS domain S-box protein [Euryarchaeota archaeon]|nr:PAS domain S-box protein [Euryarchaeota archaeon]